MTFAGERMPRAQHIGRQLSVVRMHLVHSHATVFFFDISTCLNGISSLPLDVHRVLTREEQDAALRLHHHADRVRALLSRYLLRTELATCIGTLPEQLCFQLNDWGKPALRGVHLQFNVSHAGSLIALCIAHTDVGIDIEPQRAIPESDSILRHFFTQEEISWHECQPDREAAFLTLWTRKEALYKAMGRGLGLPLNFVAVLPDQDSVHGWHIDTLFAPAGFHAALAWRRVARA